ncbi:MAG: hypothetical protein RL262_638 [Bacteroidota bacterium]
MKYIMFSGSHQKTQNEIAIPLIRPHTKDEMKQIVSDTSQIGKIKFTSAGNIIQCYVSYPQVINLTLHKK